MHHEIGGWLWLAIDVGMVVVLAALILYGTTQWRKWRRHPTHVRERNRATREAYAREERRH